MDHGERQRLKQLANDSIIATFGYDTNEARLAQALESAVEEFQYIATDCDHCKYCDIHGECDDSSMAVDAGEVMGVHAELKKQLQALKDFHVKLATALTEDVTDSVLPDELAEIIEDTESQVDELEACVIP